MRTHKRVPGGALHFLIAMNETLGDAWLYSRYRLGASALLNDLLRQKKRSGPERIRHRMFSTTQRMGVEMMSTLHA